MFHSGLSLSITKVVAGRALVVLTVIARGPEVIAIGNFDKYKFTAFKTWKLTEHLWPHSEVMETDRMSTRY